MKKKLLFAFLTCLVMIVSSSFFPSNNSFSTVEINAVAPYWRTKDNLNCRKTAGTSGTILGVYKKGIKVYEANPSPDPVYKNGYWWVKVKGTATSGKTVTGWVATKYLAWMG